VAGGSPSCGSGGGQSDGERDRGGQAGWGTGRASAGFYDCTTNPAGDDLGGFVSFESAEEGQMTDIELPPHVEQSVRAIERLHAEHQESASFAESFLDRVKTRLSHPGFVAVFLCTIAAWGMTNLALPLSLRPDPPPFLYMEIVLSVAAVLLTILILATQRRADQLAGHREKLILQLAFVSEQKVGKLISLLEELRHDLPHVRDRFDKEAEQMIEKIDAEIISEALRDDNTADSTTIPAS
jgi:uncharacterized membrane protein